VTRSVLDAPGIEAALDRMAAAVCAQAGDAPWAVVGIRRGGEPLASRLAALMARRAGMAPPLGMVDATLYRDDGFAPRDWPVVGATRLDFDLRQHTVVLVDDVLFTGRTARAALEAILGFGRPKAVRLVVLVDRGMRQLPLAADVVGIKVEARADEQVTVRQRAAGDAEDAVVVEAMGEPSRARRAGKEGP
jgi:pyrimidine operon attenuation protein / uracil phosphoribosyltransferase